ncbi:hypothetical protein AJ85_18985 [Alkalihalobacillus alcalophilus ATCC 27647 = CGMCC 1.3604]|uniref:Transposase n=1 Tax=Alkalihalobacillus alcalophilus ATCC 27647 = CGMCC 1.3604 TaxID=1218173 RepID=A0A4S4JVI4_ALKAL|nr:hypothetical protein [Alkalihalobacillus alcalophilus]MED1562029.1 hypothetical protein [Alkalihalobacillus alcalophilus]THG89196.1 hypothetical protein AJ85_18985 [Alkalihalobacillus alcalophilus ATCC 27647 = CGMCC 1.3604]
MKTVYKRLQGSSCTRNAQGRKNLKRNFICVWDSCKPITQWNKAALDQLPSAFDPSTKKADKMKEEYEQQIETLYAEVGRLTTELSWLKKNWL